MAHPLTQQPPSSLPFQFAARPSPLGFGFGSPASPSSFAHTPSHRPFGANAPTWSPSPSSRIATPTRTRPAPYSLPTNGSLKRSRHTRSPSSSPPVSPTHSGSLSPRLHHDRANKIDLSQVDQLALRDDTTSLGESRKQAKRSRAEDKPGGNASDSNVDVGVMLATLPSSAHLPILLHLLRNDPTLAEVVLSQIPPLDPRACLNELQSYIDRIQKIVGPSIPMYESSANIWQSRRWERVRTDVEGFCSVATTYLNHMSSQRDQTVSNPQSLFTLLQFATVQLGWFLRLIPPSPSARAGSQPEDTCRAPVELAKLVLSSWTKWVDDLCVNVNQRGEMFPHSLVSAWLGALDDLTAESQQNPITMSSASSSQASQSSHWSSSSSTPVHGDQSPSLDSLVLQFQGALIPIRQKFVSELGWLVGRS